MPPLLSRDSYQFMRENRSAGDDSVALARTIYIDLVRVDAEKRSGARGSYTKLCLAIAPASGCDFLDSDSGALTGTIRCAVESNGQIMEDRLKTGAAKELG